MYIYKSHLGGYYQSDTLYDTESLYCERCRDYDEYLGKAYTALEAETLLYRDNKVSYNDEEIDKAINENTSYDYLYYVNKRKKLDEYIDEWFKEE